MLKNLYNSTVLTIDPIPRDCFPVLGGNGPPEGRGGSRELRAETAQVGASHIGDE